MFGKDKVVLVEDVNKQQVAVYLSSVGHVMEENFGTLYGLTLDQVKLLRDRWQEMGNSLEDL